MEKQIQLCLVPGVLCDNALFDKVIPFLNKNIRIINHSIAHFTSIQDAVDSLNQKIDTNAFLLGFSLGGWVVETYARKYPNKTQGLILVSTAHSPIEVKAKMSMSAVCQQLEKKPDSLDTVLEESIDYYFDSSVSDKVIQEYKSMATRVGPKAAIAHYKIIINQKKTIATTTDINLPVSMMHGNSDHRDSIEHQEQLMKLYPQATMTLIRNSGHFIPLEKPQEMAQAINYFLENNELDK